MTHGRTAAFSPAGPNPTTHKNPRLRDMIRVPPKFPKIPEEVIHYFKIIRAKIDLKLKELLPPNTCNGARITYACGHERRVHHSNCPLTDFTAFARKCHLLPRIKHEEWCTDCDDLVRSVDDYDESFEMDSYIKETPLLLI